ncbi:MAG: response regulator transcription factor [Ignavibacteriaceae bacterium]|nr:response regulator transcription factor [Ignavibacteriaceae bacterium]
MNKEISVIIADDHPIIRQAVSQILQTNTYIKVIGEADNGNEAVELIRNLKPDVAILDIQMPGIDGLEVAKIIISENHSTKIVFLTMFKEPALIRRVFEMGIKGYILKESAVLDIVKCVLAVVENNFYLSPQVSQVLLETQEKPVKENNLTPTEKNILLLISKGKSSDEIAQEMFIARKTVENHRSNICKKLGITGNFALVKYALKMFSEGDKT